MNNLELRMYGLVPYNISEIQKGIQFGHAVVEYGLQFFNTEYYQDWAKNWKTFIILNGGTSNHGPTDQGTMENHQTSLQKEGIECAIFNEPDMNFMTSGIVFIVDERVFNREKYPDFDLYSFYPYSDRQFLKYNEIFADPYNPIFPHYVNPTFMRSEWDKWVDSVGGLKNVFLRNFLKNFRLA